MIKFYFHPSPNPLKIALYLEETGEPYELIPVDTRKGEQHSDAFKAINPNAKTPAMLDDDVRVFDSNAMLLYLADVCGHGHWPVLWSSGSLQTLCTQAK
jgi:GST-like protein